MIFQSKVLLINGPNLNLLGVREPNIYGAKKLQDVIDSLLLIAIENKTELIHFQSNHEGALIDFINAEYLKFLEKSDVPTAFIVNLGGYSHTSVALLDALAMFPKDTVPIYEVHITNIFRREHFRHHSFVSSIAVETIVNSGVYGYEMALRKIFDVFKFVH